MAQPPRTRGPSPSDVTEAAPEALLNRVTELEAEVRELKNEVARLRTRHLRPNETDTVLGAALTEREAVVDEVERLAHVGTWLWNVRTQEVAWSDEFFRIFGLDPAVHRPTVEAFFEGIHPEDRDAVMTASRKAVETGVQQPDTRCRIVRLDGSVRHIVVNGMPIRDQSGELIRLVGAVLDVTQFVQVETELRRTAELLTEAQRIAKVGSFTWYASDNRIEWSETLRGIFAIPLDAKVTPAQFLERVHVDDRERVERSRQQLFSGTPTEPFEYRLILPDARVRHVYTDARVECDIHAKVVRALATIQDVTERKELEEQLRHSQKMEAIGTLAGGVAHDFNNYLLVIQGNLDLLRAGLRSNLERELLEDIERAAGRCETLTRQLLAFSRKQASTPRRIDVNQIVQESARLLGRVLGEHIELIVKVDPEPASIQADPAHIEQVIMNLAINARDAMQEGGLLRIEVERRVVGGLSSDNAFEGEPLNYAVLRVSDTGSGIPDELRERVFEPFFTTKDPGRGTGLGLATVYGIVQQCGGHIEFHSRLGHGTTFDVFLPLHRSDSETRGPSTRPALPEGTELILLVEDEPQVRRLTRLLLERSGYRVVEAENGEIALAVAEQVPGIDLVLTDVTMPRMNGIDLVQRLRVKFPGIRMLLMSGYPEGQSLGTTEGDRKRILYKPFTAERLLNRVRQALEGVEANHDSRE